MYICTCETKKTTKNRNVVLLEYICIYCLMCACQHPVWFDFSNWDIWIPDLQISVCRGSSQLVKNSPSPFCTSPWTSTVFPPDVPSKILSETRCTWVQTKAGEMIIFFQWGLGYCSNKVFDQNKMRGACLMRREEEVMWLMIIELKILKTVSWRQFLIFLSLTSVNRNDSKKFLELLKSKVLPAKKRQAWF